MHKQNGLWALGKTAFGSLMCTLLSALGYEIVCIITVLSLFLVSWYLIPLVVIAGFGISLVIIDFGVQIALFGHVRTLEAFKDLDISVFSFIGFLGCMILAHYILTLMGVI